MKKKMNKFCLDGIDYHLTTIYYIWNTHNNFICSSFCSGNMNCVSCKYVLLVSWTTINIIQLINIAYNDDSGVRIQKPSRAWRYCTPFAVLWMHGTYSNRKIRY